MIYLDDSATTKVDERVLDAMLPFYKEYYGNSSSVHSFGQKSRFAIDEARYTIASFLQCTPQEIIFTSTGSESISLALKGTAEYLATKNGKFEPEKVHIITSPLEHSSVHKTIAHLGYWGYKNHIIDVNNEGLLILDPETGISGNPVNNLKSLRQILDDISSDSSNLIIVSVQHVNSETGAIQDIKRICEIAHEYNAIVHTDAMQSAKLIDINVRDSGVDLLTFASHKIYGPLGAAVLYIKSGSKISRQIDGGEQEYKIRAGTHNTPAIVGFGKAVELLSNERNERLAYIQDLSNKFISLLTEYIPNVRVLSLNKRMVSIHSVVLPGVKASEFLVRLDMAGIMASAGSACNSGAIQPMANLSYLGLSDTEIDSVVRFSIGKNNNIEEINESVKIISEQYNAYIQR
ncbi:MAG: cysteine desulfurase family protein [bacterium]